MASTNRSTTIRENEAEQIECANALGLEPRGRALTVDHGSSGVADTALRFTRRFV